MKPIEAFFARIGDDPLICAFEEAGKIFPPSSSPGMGSMGKPPAWEGGVFEDFAVRLFLENAHRPLALYVHVPFCRHRCSFCPFFKNIATGTFSAEYTALLAREIDATAKTLGNAAGERRVDAIYFGGGTPSDLDLEDMSLLIRLLRKRFFIAPDAEITVEGGIRGFSAEKGRAWVDAGANRFSLGVQTADSRLRRRLGRFSRRDEIREVLQNLCASEATVIVDLIYGFPEQTADTLLDDIRFVSEETGIHGLDLYKLNLFSGSPLDRAIARGTMPKPPDFRQMAKMYGAAYEKLVACGFKPFTQKHWRRDNRERSVYNRLAFKADMIPFGSGAGGRIGDVSLGNAGVLEEYSEKISRGEKPLSRIAYSPRKQSPFGKLLDEALEELHLPALNQWPRDCRVDADKLLSQWRDAGLLRDPEEKDGGMRLTCAGNFWSGHMKKLLMDFVAQSG
ncbi:MAG: heme anaerobic degradation radical SAM methyltransferase ChuW/HutW [Candidatus Accumulibacter sp.]|nr:heme anaerobic degradation radical SAM methyltransferase ChuW/HutW [Accumulibacter sp.]